MTETTRQDRLHYGPDQLQSDLESRRIEGHKYFLKFFWLVYKCPPCSENYRAVLASWGLE